jgi:membrane protein
MPGLTRGALWDRSLLFARTAGTDFARNNGSYMAASIAYWILFSAFPLAMAGMSILGYLYATPEDQAREVERLVTLFPVSGGYLAEVMSGLTATRGSLGMLAAVGLLFSGAKVFAALRRGINQVWEIQNPHPFMQARMIDLIMLIGAGVIASAAVLGTQVATMPALAGQADGVTWLVIRAIQETATLAFTFGVLLLIYRYIPNTSVAWRHAAIGAAAGSMLLLSIRVAFIIFVARTDGFSLLYGSLWALMAVLSWAYFSSMALMWGAQIAATNHKLSRLAPSGHGKERATAELAPKLQ